MTRNFAAKAVHKQMYPATYNFRDDDIGGNPADWVLDEVGGTINIISDLDGHKKVVELDYEDDLIDMVHTFDSIETDDTIECYVANSSIGAVASYLIIYEGITVIIQLRFISGDLGEFSGGGYNIIKADFMTANVFNHIKIVCDDTANTYDLYIDGVLEGDDKPYRNNSTTGINKVRFMIVSDLKYYVDAIGFSHDTDYNVGDNCFWRHYKESESKPFEEDDVGLTGTNITWVQGVDTAASVVLTQEFNEHKKVLRIAYTSAVGGYDYGRNFYAATKTGWFSWWWKASNVGEADGSLIHFYGDVGILISLRIAGDKFQYYTRVGAWEDVGLAATDGTWYHVYMQWYDAATDNFDLWIDNVQYLDGISTRADQTNGLDEMRILQYDSGYGYFDAIITSISSDSRGDNRLFDYNDAYTREDVTTETINVYYTNKLHEWRTANLYSNREFENSEVFFQIYDVNGALAFEGEIQNRFQEKTVRNHKLLDKNLDDLLTLMTETFSADDIHDPTDSTSMLKTTLPNVSEADGDLILVDADVKTDTYSPVLKNYPKLSFLQDISDIADSVVIIEANGKCHLDDDRASGDSLDYDTAADHALMTAPPRINDILDTINYFEIFGAINPDTGERFYKITDNSGTDRKRKWRIVNNNFRSQTDVDAYAAKLVSKLVAVREIIIETQGLGAHNMGELFTYKYDEDTFTITSAAYYIVAEVIDFDLAVNEITLSEGLIESSKYAAGFEKPQNYQDTYAAEIYETDKITVVCGLFVGGGATREAGYIILDDAGEQVHFTFYIPDTVDNDKDIIINFAWLRGDNNNDTVAILRDVIGFACDGSGDSDVVFNDATTLPACLTLKYMHDTWTIPAADVHNNYVYKCVLELNEAAREINMVNIEIQYYIKRSV